jgi:hypothetical protein
MSSKSNALVTDFLAQDFVVCRQAEQAAVQMLRCEPQGALFAVISIW